jgi:hypothetical protein
MSTTTLRFSRLLETGPRVWVRVGISSADEERRRRLGEKAPEPVRALALIDTGSGRSILQSGLAAELALPPVGSVEIDTPAATDFPALEFEARIWFDERTDIEVRVLEAPLKVPRVRVLVGRDVLARGRMVYDGRRNEVTLEL